MGFGGVENYDDVLDSVPGGANQVGNWEAGGFTDGRVIKQAVQVASLSLQVRLPRCSGKVRKREKRQFECWESDVRV